MVSDADRNHVQAYIDTLREWWRLRLENLWLEYSRETYEEAKARCCNESTNQKVIDIQKQMDQDLVDSTFVRGRYSVKIIDEYKNKGRTVMRPDKETNIAIAKFMGWTILTEYPAQWAKENIVDIQTNMSHDFREVLLPSDGPWFLAPGFTLKNAPINGFPLFDYINNESRCMEAWDKFAEYVKRTDRHNIQGRTNLIFTTIAGAHRRIRICELIVDTIEKDIAPSTDEPATCGLEEIKYSYDEKNECITFSQKLFIGEMVEDNAVEIYLNESTIDQLETWCAHAKAVQKLRRTWIGCPKDLKKQGIIKKEQTEE